MKRAFQIFTVVILVFAGINSFATGIDSLTSNKLFFYLDRINENPFLKDRSLEKSNRYKTGALLSFGENEFASKMQVLSAKFPFQYNEQVNTYIHLYADVKADKTEVLLGMGKDYFPVIEKVILDNGLPKELKYLPAVLSSCNQTALSAEGQKGLWQLQFTSAIRYGLQIDDEIDERNDVKLSTLAACKSLNSLYAYYKSWPMAITAFVGSPALVNQAVKRSGDKTSFEEIYPFLDSGVKDYWYAFCALSFIGEYHEKQNARYIVPGMVYASEKVNLTHKMHIGQPSEVLAIPYSMLHEMNIVYKKDIISSTDGKSAFNLPVGYTQAFKQKEQEIYRYKDSIFFPPTPIVNSVVSNKSNTDDNAGFTMINKYHKVRSGETLSKIAKNYGVSKSQLRKWNNLSSDKLKSGKRLIVQVIKKEKPENEIKKDNKEPEVKKDVVKNAVDTTAVVKTTTVKSNPSPEVQWTYYTVKSGDTLSSIGEKYHVSYTKIKEWNGLRSDRINIGQKLKIKKK